MDNSHSIMLFSNSMYNVIYDARYEYQPWLILLSALVMLMMVRFTPILGNKQPYLRKFMIGFLTLWIVFAGWGVISQFVHVKSTFKTGDFVVTEGQVEDFVPMVDTPQLHQRESFRVNGVSFQYFDADTSFRFKQPGVVHPGMRLRITHKNGEIIKLEEPSPK